MNVDGLSFFRLSTLLPSTPAERTFSPFGHLNKDMPKQTWEQDADSTKTPVAPS